MNSFPALLVALSILSAPAIVSAQSFEIVPTPNPNPERTLLRGIAGSSAEDVWAVGDSRVTDVLDRHLVLHWNGLGWTETAAPQVNDAQHMLWDVSALAPDLAWAAGLYAEGAGLASGYVLRWDGTQWSLDFHHAGWAIFDIWAIGADDVWAVGITNDALTKPPLALHWNGSSWTRIDPPKVGNRDQDLEAVHASASDNVWAVGSYRNMTSLSYLAYVVRWNGSRWDHVPLATPPNVWPVDVWTFGPSDTWVATDVGSVYHWNGSGWTEHAASVGSFAGIASDDLYGLANNTVQHWDGTAWSAVQELALSDPAFRNAAAVLSDGTIWGAGRTIEANGDMRSLAVRGGWTPVVSGVNEASQSPHGVSPALPNPFRHETEVRLSLGREEPVSMAAFDVHGRRVATLHEGTLPQGIHRIRFHAAGLPSGLYLIRTSVGDRTLVRRALLVR
ncbi:MAG TPA: hypothetical protein VFP58_01395 [Candidatus Eisenbacteria bacterium]|nr:hypothetical protein [Candidatus Eisenbacteria bacterium]